MNSNDSFIDTLKQDHQRLGHLLNTIDNGRWWTADEPGRVKLDELTLQAAQIRASIDVIEQTVGAIGKLKLLTYTK